MDNLHILLNKAKNNEISAYINGIEITIKDDKGLYWNCSYSCNIYYLCDFSAIEEAEDMSCYFLHHEDEDMPFELSFAKKIKINEII